MNCRFGAILLLVIGVTACRSSASDGEPATPSQRDEVSVAPPVVPPAVTSPPTAEAASTTAGVATTVAADVANTAVTLGGAVTPYRVPVADADRAGWGTTHAGYTASDIFVGCGASIVAPVNGVVAEARRVNSWDPAIDNPATRGGRSVAIIGDDGVRYYMAHFERIDDGIEPGTRVAVGQALGEMGQTGRASACHVHFGISPPCPGKEWSVRRGVIWPYPYLDDWRGGGQRSPVDEIRRWLADHPTACSDAMSDPNAADS